MPGQPTPTPLAGLTLPGDEPKKVLNGFTTQSTEPQNLMPLKFNYHGDTDQGLVRKINEDNLLLLPENNLFIVCDGMGGHSAGEVASRTAVGAIAATFRFQGKELSDDPLLNLEEDLPSQADLLVKSIRLANRRIFNRGSVDANLSGMGTTVAGVVFADKLACISHVGDSRVYVYRKGELIPLTEDHSWVAEVQAAGNISEEAASTLVNKNIITRALGIKESVEVDIRLEEVQPDDFFVLCSDGLCGYATDPEIQKVVETCNQNPKKTVDQLIRMANDRGGSDNVTVVCIKITETDSIAGYSPKPAITVPAESISAGEREDEWLDILAEQAQERRSEASATPAAAEAVVAESTGSRAYMLTTLMILLILTAIVYYFFGEAI